MAPIEVRTSWTEAEWMGVHQRLKRDTWRMFAGSSVGMLATAVMLWLTGTDSDFMLLSLGISLGPALAILVGRHQLRQAYRTQPELAVEALWTFTEEGFRCDGATSHWTGDWTVFDRVARNADGLILWTPLLIGHWLPLRGFTTAGDVERLEALARAKVKIFQDLRG